MKKKLSLEHRAKVIRSLKIGKGNENGNWKGGRSMQGGYVIVRIPLHPNARSNGYYPEHRLVMEQKIGRLLSRHEVVHHLNGVKTDNRPENLALTTHHEHGAHHWRTDEARKKQSVFMKTKRAERFWSTRKVISI